MNQALQRQFLAPIHPSLSQVLNECIPDIKGETERERERERVCAVQSQRKSLFMMTNGKELGNNEL
jgi:hypothetical protein